MGITGLLPFLKSASHSTNIRNYSGCTVAVDSYCWLHKGAFSCADKLAKGEETDGYIIYCMKMVNSLIAAGVRPIMVFDGQNLPSKALTEKKRREERQIHKRKGKNYLIEGKLKEARESFQRCTEVTSEMAHNLIKSCRKIGVDCIVAPYEADAQLAYLNKIGIVQIVITEDSDLVLFGCEKIMYKMDINGNGIMVEKSRIKDCLGNNDDNFSFDKFRYMCIMSGCDYLPSLSGIGLKKAMKFFSKTLNPDLSLVLPKIPIYLNMPSVIVTQEYIKNFIQANNTFLHQLVFDPLKRKVVPLNPYVTEVDPNEFSYAGPPIAHHLGLQIALGNINTDTMKRVDDYDPILNKVVIKSVSWIDKSPANYKSIWDPDYTIQAADCSSKQTKPTLNECAFMFKRDSSTCGKRLLEASSDNFVGTTNEELLSMYNSEVRTSKLNRTLSVLNVGECEKMMTTQMSLPTLTSSSYFAKSSSSASVVEPVNSDKKDIVKDTSENTDNNIFDKLSKTTSSLQFDKALQSLNHVKNESPFSSANKFSKSANSPANFGAKYRDLFQRYGYNVSDRLTLSPLNHTPFKSVLATSNNSDTPTVSQSSDNYVETLNSQSSTSQDETLILGGSIDQESFNSLTDNSQNDSLDKQPNDLSSTMHNSNYEQRSDIKIAKRQNRCKAPGLSRRHSVTSAQQDGSKRQLSLKESFAKFEFSKNGKKFTFSQL